MLARNGRDHSGTLQALLLWMAGASPTEMVLGERSRRLTLVERESMPKSRQ
jgi:hypothetical protein